MTLPISTNSSSEHDAFLEVTPEVIRAAVNSEFAEWPLERTSSGRLSEDGKHRLVSSLSALNRRPRWLSRPRAWCGLDARGVSIRTIRLPRASAEEFDRLLLLQIESEFPLQPDELAWGHLPAASPSQPDDEFQEVFVAAVKREAVDEMRDILQQAGFQPEFTLAALARHRLVESAHLRGAASIVEMGRHQSELMSFDARGPAVLRLLPQGTEPRQNGSHAELPPLAILADSVLRAHPVERVFVSGTAARESRLLTVLGNHLGPRATIETLEPEAEHGSTAALRGLRKSVQERDQQPLLILETRNAPAEAGLRNSVPWKWIGACAVLLLILGALPYLDAWFNQPALAARLESFNKVDQQKLDLIDRKYGFLRFLKQTQPPYLDALTVISKCLPPGAQMERFSMNRRGDFSLQGIFPGSQQVVDFRTKLVDSGFFSSVTITDQSPAPDRRKLNVKVDAVVRPPEGRQDLPILRNDNTAVSNSPPARGTAPAPPPGSIAPPRAG